MKTAQSYKDLLVWQKSIELVVQVYKLTENFPQREVYGLASQMRRAAVSIPSNIAEGRSRSTAKDFTNFLHIALGSGTELETQIIISKKLLFCNDGQFDEISSLLSEVCRMLHGMINGLKAGN